MKKVIIVISTCLFSLLLVLILIPTLVVLMIMETIFNRPFFKVDTVPKLKVKF